MLPSLHSVATEPSTEEERERHSSGQKTRIKFCVSHLHLSRRPFLMHALQGEEFFPPKRSSSAKGVCRGVEKAEYGRLLAGRHMMDDGTSAIREGISHSTAVGGDALQWSFLARFRSSPLLPPSLSRINYAADAATPSKTGAAERRPRLPAPDRRHRGRQRRRRRPSLK